METALKKLLFEKISKEMDNQFKKFGVQDHSYQEWYCILMEEIGEIAKAIIENDSENFKEEVIQSITVLVQIFKKMYFM